MGSLLLKLIIGQLNQYVLSVSASNGSAGTETPVILGNIATAPIAGGDNSKLKDKVVVSLVNIAEKAPEKQYGVPAEKTSNISSKALSFTSICTCFLPQISRNTIRPSITFSG